MFKLLSSFISPRSSVNVTEQGILHSHIVSVSKLFQEKMFKFARLQIIGAKSVIAIKISGIFHRTVTQKFLMNLITFTNFLLTLNTCRFFFKKSNFQDGLEYFSFFADRGMKQPYDYSE